MQDEAKARPRVYVMEQQPFDYSPASVYGDVIFLESQKLAPDAPGAGHGWNTKVKDQLRQGLSDYVPEHDFIIPTGSPVKLLVLGALLKERGPRHNVLGFDARTGRYLHYVVVV